MAPSVPVLVRDASEADWSGIWPILERVVRAGDTYTWPVDTGEDEARRLWLPASPWRTFVVADADGSIVGSAKLGPNQSGPGDHVANASFLVDPDRSGHGIGRRLAEYVLDAARSDGYRAMQFNAVVETNGAAVALWRSLGFEALATVPGAFRHPTHGDVGLLVMYRTL